MADAQELLGVEIAIGQLPGNEGCDDRPDTTDDEYIGDLAAIEVQVSAQVGKQQRQPSAPDRVLEKHHHRELHVEL